MASRLVTQGTYIENWKLRLVSATAEPTPKPTPAPRPAPAGKLAGRKST